MVDELNTFIVTDKVNYINLINAFNKFKLSSSGIYRLN